MDANGRKFENRVAAWLSALFVCSAFRSAGPCKFSELRYSCVLDQACLVGLRRPAIGLGSG